MRCSLIVVLCLVLGGCGGDDSNQTSSVAASAPENVRDPSEPKPIQTPVAQPPLAADGQAAGMPQSQESSSSGAAPAQTPAATGTADADAFPAPIDTSSNPPAAPFSGEEQANGVVVPDEIQRLGDPCAESHDEFLKQMVGYPSAAIRKRLVEKVTSRSIGRNPGYGEEGIHALRGSLLDPNMDVRLAATSVVSNWGGLEDSRPFAKQAIPELALNLQHDNQVLVQATIGSLSNFGPDAAPALPHLRWKLRQSKDNDSMVSFLCRVFGGMGPAAAQAVPELEAVAFSGIGSNGMAWDAIAKIGDQAAIRGGLESDDFSARLQSSGAAEFIEKLDPETTVALRKLLKDDESMIRGNAAQAIGKTTPMTEELATEIAALLKDDDWARSHAAFGLAVIQPQFDVAREALMAGREDEDDDVTKACREAFANYSSTGKVLLKVTFDKASKEQNLDINNDAVLPVFDDYFAVLEDTESDVFDRVCAYRSLHQISFDSKATEEQKKRVEGFRKTLLDPSVPFQLRIAALKKLDDGPRENRELTREQLVKGINGCVLRDLRIRCLGYCSDQAIEAAFPEVVKVIASAKEADQKLHYTAISTLHRYGKLANNATPHLLKLLDNSDTQPMVLKALGDIGASPDLTVPAINKIIAENELRRSLALVALAKKFSSQQSGPQSGRRNNKEVLGSGQIQS